MVVNKCYLAVATAESAEPVVVPGYQAEPVALVEPAAISHCRPDKILRRWQLCPLAVMVAPVAQAIPADQAGRAEQGATSRWSRLATFLQIQSFHSVD